MRKRALYVDVAETAPGTMTVENDPIASVDGSAVAQMISAARRIIEKLQLTK